ncbi:MAG: CCA tRNA nucleotidyltransferase [Chloroflexi bacterium]|nr:CCA tRNA nucleotidyltransferase [Chloroflexota bacterium]
MSKRTIPYNAPMPSPPDIEALLRTALSEGCAWAVDGATSVAERMGTPLYLVGGGVRDMLMGRAIKDLDLVVEGDTAPFVETLAPKLGGRIALRSQFGTAVLKVGSLNVDIVMARRETYARPGALPAVTPGSIAEDLGRRDFTIHALAVRLHPRPYSLLDPTGGLGDLEARLVRILHPGSFQDDATRILRAVRYEQRLGFRLEPETEARLRRDVAFLDTISGDRLRRELDLVFQESVAPQVLRRGAELGVLRAVHPALPDLPDMEERLAHVQRLDGPLRPLHYLALLAHGLDQGQRRSLASRLNVARRWAEVLEDTARAREEAERLDPGERPSRVYRRLAGLRPEAVEVAAAFADRSVVGSQMLRYAREWSQVKPFLAGDDLVRMGAPPGPRVGEALEALRDALLDGVVRTREEEEAFCRRFLQTA